MVTEAINSEKSWDEIKDLLWLKLCNGNIHTYTLCFMEIQQQGKESLTAYVHQFKTEDQLHLLDATSQMMLLPSESSSKYAHNLATCIYEKGPQMLIDAILEVEKLNAVQQLTAMIITPSTVNMESREEDHCFQHQE